MLPPDAMEKAAAAGRDYYADLTDEERAEEGLPPREQPAKPDPAPEPATPAAPAKTDGDGEEGEGEEALDDEAIEQLFRDVASLKDDLVARTGEKQPTTKKAEDEFLEAALEHEDPIVRAMAERLQEQQRRLDAQEEAARDRTIAEQMEADEKEFQAVKESYLIGGKPMTDAHIEKVEHYIIRNPEVGRVLTIEEATRRVFPDAVRAPRPKSPPAKGPGDSSNGGSVATIVDGGSGSGGGPTDSWKPRPNETVESAVAEAGRRLFGVRR